MTSDRVNKNNRERDLERTLFFTEVSFVEPSDNVQIGRCIWRQAGRSHLFVELLSAKIITYRDLLSIFFA